MPITLKKNPQRRQPFTSTIQWKSARRITEIPPARSANELDQQFFITGHDKPPNANAITSAAAMPPSPQPKSAVVLRGSATSVRSHSPANMPKSAVATIGIIATAPSPRWAGVR